MFEHLPNDFREAQKVGLVPWIELVREDFHVIVYKDGNNLIFVPRYATDGVLRDCFSDALNVGQTLADNKQCAKFAVVMSNIDDIIWPHVTLILTQTVITKKQQEMWDKLSQPLSSTTKEVDNVMLKALKLAQRQLNNYKDIK